ISAIDLLNVQATVPLSAATDYTGTQILTVTNVSINGGSTPTLGDNSLQLVVYPGDAKGVLGTSATNTWYNPPDALAMAQVAAGVAGSDTGFAAYRLIDPVLVGGTSGTTGEAGVSPADALYVAQANV